MLSAQHIVGTAVRPDPQLDDKRRRYYQLAHFGQRVLQAEVARMARLVQVAQAKPAIAGAAS